MGISKLAEDRAVLRAKFENVNRLLQQYGNGIKTIEAALATLDILEPDASVEQLAETALGEFAKLSRLGVDTALVEKDLAAAVTAMGDYAKHLGEWMRIAQATSSNYRPANDLASARNLR